MKRSHKSGLGFGVTSGIIMPIGLIVGLYSSTQNTGVVIGGILTAAIADSFADSLGVHVSKESDHQYSTKEVWEATIATFFSKFFFALMFILPLLLFPLKIAVLTAVILGITILSFFSYFIAKGRNGNPWFAIFEHIGIAVVVIAITYYLPPIINQFFG